MGLILSLRYSNSALCPGPDIFSGAFCNVAQEQTRHLTFQILVAYKSSSKYSTNLVTDLQYLSVEQQQEAFKPANIVQEQDFVL